MTKSISIDGRLVGEGHSTYVIAEVGCNHNGDLSLAKEMIDAAKKAGCDCAKFQKFTADTFCTNRDKKFTYTSQGQEVTEREYDMFKRFEFDQDQWADLMTYCRNSGIFFMATVQDPIDLEQMLELGLKAIKVGSDDFDHFANLQLFAKTGLPLIISKGMADEIEVRKTLDSVRSLTDSLAVLHCVSLYPSEFHHLNLRQIPRLAAMYPDIVWGFSDHSRGSLASTLAVALGAHIIEKHFTISHDLPGPDQWFSMDPGEMSDLVKDIRSCESALGTGRIEPAEEERAMFKTMRRRIVARDDLTESTVLSLDTVAFKRSTNGAFISDWGRLAGQRLSKAKRRDEGITIDDLQTTGPEDH
jgi:sialic acid synthase SpsE